MDAQRDVVIGWSWWAYGPPAWWGGYHFTLCPSGDYAVDDPKMAWLAPRFADPAAAGIRPTISKLPSPSDGSYASKKMVNAGEHGDVPVGLFVLKVAVRSIDGDDDHFCVQIIVENPSAKVDIDWQQMSIDLPGHELLEAWDCQVAGTAGLVTVTPVEQTKAVRARSKTSFGFCVRRDRVSTTRESYQVRVKALTW